MPAGYFSEVDVGGSGSDGLIFVFNAAGTEVFTVQQWGILIIDPASQAQVQVGPALNPLTVWDQNGSPTFQFIQDPSLGGVSLSIGGSGNPGSIDIADASGLQRILLDTTSGLDIVDPASQAQVQVGPAVNPFTVWDQNGTPTFQFIQDPSFGAVSLSIGGPGNPGYINIVDGSGNSQFILDAAPPGQPVIWFYGDINVGGDVLLQGADCAEQFDISGAEPEPGTVLVIDEGGSLRESRVAYDKKVAGVVSGAGDYKHAILLDNQPHSESRVPVSLVGKVYCKVDATYSPIRVGDLLTTSPTPGHAMKAADPARAVGATLGKALRPLRSGRKLIPMLVSLQ
jgi:hypothetical protein